MEAKFTKGPWHTESYRTKAGLREPPDGVLIADAHGNVIAELPRSFFGNQGNLKNNADLMAASPEMFGALNEAFFALGRLGNNVANGPERAAWERCRAAIQKATGER